MNKKNYKWGGENGKCCRCFAVFVLQMPVNKFGIINVIEQFPYCSGMSWDRWVMIIKFIKGMPRYAFQTKTDSLGSMLASIED